MIDLYTPHLPSKLTLRVNSRPAGTFGQEFIADIKLPTESPPWQVLRLTPDQFHDPELKGLPNWDHVEVFILQGESSVDRPPVFRNLRWE